MLVCYPLLLLAISSNWIFTPAGYIDPWVYYGYFQDLIAFKNDDFLATHYYGSRLAWILPGYGVHRLLGNPEAASIVLHLAVYYLAVLSLYFTLKGAVGRRGALLGSLLLGGYAFFLNAAGWDYVDGAGIAYCLLSLAFLTHGSGRRAASIAYLAAGAAAASMVHANLLCLIFCPLLGLYWLASVKINHGRFPSIGASSIALWWFVAGASLLSFLLGLVNYWICGAWLFFLPSIRFALHSMATTNPWAVPGTQWLAHAKWLVLPAMTFVAVGVSAIAAWKRRQALAYARVFGVLFGVALLLLVGLEAAGSPMLQLFYYASYLIPWLFLTLGSALAPMFEGLTRAGFAVAAVFCLVVFPVPLWGAAVLQQVATHFGLWLPLAFGALLIPVFLLRRPGRWASAVVLFALCACHATLAPFAHSRAQRHAARLSFQRIAGAAQIIENVAGSAEVQFWYDRREKSFPEFLSLNSVFIWGHHTIGMDFPDLPQSLRLKPATILAIPSERDDIPTQVREQLLSRGLIATPLPREPAGGADAPYWLYFFRTPRN
ncbi:MAG: hypothetical protein WD733_10915 [Bryobacterales bacterium]